MPPTPGTQRGRPRPPPARAAANAARRAPLRHGPTGGPPTLYLTFDDGPEPSYTPEVLDVLAAYDVPATFFVIGRKVREHPELAREAAAAGHSVQNHTLSHSDLTRLSRAAKTAEIVDGVGAIWAAAGREPRCLRPPYGDVDAATVRRARELQTQLVLWDLDPRDWTRPGVQRIVRRVLAGAHPGGIVLLHDGGKDRRQTIAALRQLLPALLQRGYRFASLCR